MSFAHLVEVLSELTQTGRVAIFDTDSYTERDISMKQVLARIFLVALWDYRIKRFRRNSLSRSLYAFAREAKNELRKGLGHRARTWLARNRNITAAHSSLWSQAIESEADWVVIVEDDVLVTDPSFVAKIRTLVEFAESQEDRYIAIFLSGSFTREQHMAENLKYLRKQSDDTHFWVSTDRGWTDTVASTIYSRQFLCQLLTFIENWPGISKETLPIDQLVDLFLLKSFRGAFQPVTIHLEHPICMQQSLG